MPKHVKGHDKDKYYHLAKDQGYRARSAFKLIQINKRFNFLHNARVCIDLCAAPGGWCQVAVQLMPKGSLVLGIDLLPIRPIRGVKTLVNDITTAECRRNIQNELKGWAADVVLCDGAPNIGSAYHKDAFVQNELVLAALKTATDHLVAGGTFCTKVYRSTDYNALMWVFQQLFADVQSIKPSSSRSQSSEIFIVCMKYTKPDKVDPKFLDPNHIFKHVQDPGLAKVDVMHKKYEQMNKRHRTGYDWDSGLLSTESSVSDFIKHSEPVRVLTDANVLTFRTDECEKYRGNKYTTPEMIECFKDLRVLGKSDFKKILKWRQRMIDWDEMERKEANGEEKSSSKLRPVEEEREETEEDVFEQILEMRAQAAQEERRQKKKQRLLDAKNRTRQNLGINNNVFDGIQADEEVFSFSQTGKGRRAIESALEEYGEDPDVVISESEDEDAAHAVRTAPIFIEEENLQDELEQDYKTYQKTRKSKDIYDLSNKVGVGAMGDEQLANKLLEERNKEDNTFNERSKKGRNQQMREEARLYAELLSKGSQPETGSKTIARKTKKGIDTAASDSSDSDSSDDEGVGQKKRKAADSDSGSDSNSDIDSNSDYDVQEDTVEDDIDRIIKSRAGSSRNDTWFSHPLFQETLVEDSERDSSEDEEIDDNEGVDIYADDQNERNFSEAARQMINSMPKTDKQMRNEKRKKEQARMERKRARRDQQDATHQVDGQAFHMDEENPKGKKSKKAKKDSAEDDEYDEATSDAIRANPDIQMGMGKIRKDKAGFEVVSRAEEKEDQFEDMRADDRAYDSSEEEYNANERAEQLALGTLMLRRGRRKALVDASYNRFTWNDPTDLPSWFAEDEMKHNKPQIPIPAALLEQIKTKFAMTGTKSVKKVAEAKMRKKKHAQAKLKAVKKQANQLVENNEMSEKEKLRAIKRAMHNSKADKPSKVYVVGSKTKGASSGTRTSNGKGKLKFVDSRMKADKRGEKLAEKRKKRGRNK